MGFQGQNCVLCQTRPSTRNGEHVWTEWLLKRFPLSAGPYTLYRDGRPVLKKDGVTPRSHNSFPRVKVPMCQRCNTTLNQRFEGAAKPVIRRILYAGGTLALSPVEANVFAHWVAKTWLLLAHPAAHHAEPRLIGKSWNLGLVPHDLYGWMVAGTDPPAVISAWLTRTTPGDADDVTTQQVLLPSVDADERIVKFQSIVCAIDILEVSVVYHPHWPIAHPLEDDGRAARLWPREPGDPLNLGALPPVNTGEMSWLSGIRVVLPPGVYGVTPLPPLSSATNLFHLPPPIEAVHGERE